MNGASLGLVILLMSGGSTSDLPSAAEQEKGEGFRYLEGTELPPALARRVEAAIERGVEWLSAQQFPSGAFSPYRVSSSGETLGMTALCLLALLASDVPSKDPVVRKGVSYLLNHRLQENDRLSSYTSALTVLALELNGAPPDERRVLETMTPQERSSYGYPRSLSPKEITRIRLDVAQLLQNQRFVSGYWSYGLPGDANRKPGGDSGGGDGDLSNTQFAILALHAARRCGVMVPDKAFLDLLDGLLDSQVPSGPPVMYRTPLKSPNTVSRFEIAYRTASAKGWPYAGFSRNQPLLEERARDLAFSVVIGSWPAIAVGSLVVCREEILQRGKVESKHRLEGQRQRLEAAVWDGLAWLDRHFSVSGRLPHNDPFFDGMPFFYFYLYSLERLGTFLDTRYIGMHDWYLEGCVELVGRQRENGSWEDDLVYNTALALLFLKRASLHRLPVFTGRFLGGVNTGAGRR